MDKSLISETIKSYFSAYEKNQCECVLNLLTEDFTFTSPRKKNINREKFFEMCSENSKSIKALHIKQLLQGKDDAIVLYEGEDQAGEKFHNAKFFRFADEKIKSVEVYFGASPSAIDLK